MKKNRQKPATIWQHPTTIYVCVLLRVPGNLLRAKAFHFLLGGLNEAHSYGQFKFICIYVEFTIRVQSAVSLNILFDLSGLASSMLNLILFWTVELLVWTVKTVKWTTAKNIFLTVKMSHVNSNFIWTSEVWIYGKSSHVNSFFFWKESTKFHV